MSHDLSRAAIPECGIGADFLFFYEVTAHDYLYWALWAATEPNPPRGGGVKVDMLSLALKRNRKEDQLVMTKKSGGGKADLELPLS